MWKWLVVLPLLFGSPCSGQETQACLTARVISVGTVDPWESGQVRFLTDDMPIFRFVPRRGVNVVALNPKDGIEVLLNRTYGPQEASAKDLEKDLDALPPHSAILVALQGMSHQAYLEPLSKIQATLFPAISPEQGYALIGSKGRVPVERVGAWVDVEVPIECVLPANWEAEQRARAAAVAAVKAAGNSIEEIGAAVKGQGRIGAEEAANRIAELGLGQFAATSGEGVQALAFRAWRAASTAGVSSKVAAQAALQAILPNALLEAMGTGDRPAAQGRMLMRIARAIPGLSEEHRVNKTSILGKRVMSAMLIFCNVREEAIEAALKALERGVAEGSVALPLETLKEWLHPEIKVDFERCSHRATQVMGHLAEISKQRLPKADSPILSKASAAEDAAAIAAARARGRSPAEIGAEAREAILALGSHQAAAMHLAAKAAANVAMFEAQRRSKSPREMGAAAKVAALAAGLHGTDEWFILKAQIARRVAEVIAAAGFKPQEVGKAVREAMVDDGGSSAAGFLQVQERLAAQTAAEVVAELVARQKSAGEVALATREAIVGSGWSTSPAAIASMAGKAAARAVAQQRSKAAKDGWQEVAKAASDAAYASLMPPAEVPRVAAEASSLEVAEAAAADGKTGEEVGLAAIAAVRAAGVSPGLSRVIASSSIALALSSCHRVIAGFTMKDVTDAARAAGAPGAVHMAMPLLAKCSAQEAARLHSSPLQAAKAAAELFDQYPGKGSLSVHEEEHAIAKAIAEVLLVKSVRGGGSGAPLDLGREVLQVLKALRFPDADAAAHAAAAAASCAVKVSLARNESGPSIGSFAVKVAASTGMKADEAKEVAAMAVIKGMLESWSTVDVNSLKHLEAGVAATGMSVEKALRLVAENGVDGAVRSCLTMGSAVESCGALAHHIVNASGLSETEANSVAQQVAARVAAEHAVQNGASPDEVRTAAEKVQKPWHTNLAKERIASHVAAKAVAKQAVQSSADARRIGLQVAQAAGRYISGHASMASAACASEVAKVASRAFVPGGPLVKEALAAIPGAPDLVEVAAHALVRAEVEQASQMNFSPEKIGLLAWSAALSMLSFEDAKRVVQMEAPKMVTFPHRGALDEVLIQQGLNSSIHDLDASAENFVRSGGAPAPNRWVNQQMLCSGVLKKSGILDVLKQLQLEDEALLVAAAVARASADFHLSPGAVASSAVAVGRDTRCAVDTICSSAALDLPVPHVAYLAARCAASAVSDRWEQFGTEPESVGHMALQAVQGAAPHLVPAVAADLAVAAAAEACATRGAAPAAAVAVLAAQQRCPGASAVPGAQAAAAAVARHCVVDMEWTPVTCGYEAHEAARAVLVACNMGMTHAAALADQALSSAYAQRAARLPAWKVYLEYRGDGNARLAAGVSMWARSAPVRKRFALRVMEAQAARTGSRAQDLGALAKLAFTRSNGTGTAGDPASTVQAAAMVVEALVRRHVLQHNSPDLIAKEAHEAAHAAGCSDHMLLLRSAVSALTDQEAALGASPSKIGASAKNLALALAVAPTTGMNSSSKELISFRSAMHVAARAAARSTMRQQLTEQHGLPIFAREAVVQAQVAARATGHPLGSRDMAELVGKTVVDISLKQGERSSLPEILQMSLLALQPSTLALRAGAFAAALAMATAEVQQGVHPPRIRKEAQAVLAALADVSPVKSHLASEATIEAVAQHGPVDQLQHLASLLREAAEWDPVTKPLPGAVVSMAFRAAVHVAQRLAPLGLPGRSVEKTRAVVEALGLPKAEARRISLRAVAQVEAELGAAWPDGCRQAGEMARKVVMAGIAPEKMGQDDLESGHAFLSLALPAALKAAIKAGPEDAEQMATCARRAAQGAMGTDAKTALQGEWITEAADLVAAEAAEHAVMEGQLPFQVTARAEKASASLRASSPESHHSDGMAAAKAILHHGLEVSADHSETARLARVAAESSGLRIEEARHQVAEQLASMVANQQAELMSLEPASSHAIAAAAKSGASAAGCGEAESAWIGSHAAAEAIAKTATERGASTKVVATLALTAAEASGVPQNQAQRISAWSASKAASNQALILGASVAETGEIALAAAHFAGLEGGTASRLAAEAAASAVLQQARDSSASHSLMAVKCKEAALHAGLEPAAASLLAASLVCPKAAEVAATMQQSPKEIGAVARAAAKAAGVEELQGAEEAGVAAASAAVQSALSAGGVHPSKVALLAQEAWRGAEANGTTVAPCIAATAVLKRLASQHHSVPEHLAKAAEAISADAPAAKRQVASILAKAVAESAARRGGREDEVAHNVLKSLRDAHPGLSEEKLKGMTAMAASTAVAKAAVQQGREPAVVSASAAKAALASGMPKKDVKDVACVAAAAAIAKHSKHVRQGASKVADLVLQAAHAAGCEDETPLAAAITAASRSAAKASLALHGTSAASMARAAWRAATEVLEHLGHGGIHEDKSLWAQIVSIEAVNDWQAQAFVAGLQGHAAEGKAKIEKAIAGVRKQERQEQERWMGVAHSEALWVVIAGVCILGLTYWSGRRLAKAAGAAFSAVTGLSSENCESRAVQKFCCAPTDEEALYSALNPPQNDSLDDDEEPIRHNVAAHAAWFDGEDRFAAPAKLVVILERAALERSRELVGSHAKAPRPDHELQFTFDALETLLDSQLNEAGRLIIFLHSAEEVIVEVHPGFCMPSSLQRFAKNMLSLLRRRRFTGSSPEAPAVLRVVDGPWDQLIPKGAAWYALSPQGESIHLKEFVRDVAGSTGFGCLPPSSSAERVPGRSEGDGASDVGHVVFSIGASAGDATKDATFRGNSLQRLSICPWDLTGAACCRMLCSEFESLWGVHRC